MLFDYLSTTELGISSCGRHSTTRHRPLRACHARCRRFFTGRFSPHRRWIMLSVELAVFALMVGNSLRSPERLPRQLTHPEIKHQVCALVSEERKMSPHSQPSG